MRVLGIVITYNPDINLLITNIEQYIKDIENLIVWINTPTASVFDYEKIFENKKYQDKLIFKGGNGNKGLSMPLNIARVYAINNNYDYLLTMDQDSYMVNFAYYVDFIEKLNNNNDIFCLRINDDSHYEKEYEEYYDLINSGTIYSISSLQKIGPFNELLNVDGIDTEYCIRAIIGNVRILIINNAKIKQTFGSHNVHQFLGKKFIVSNYSPGRLYEIMYSNVIMLREFPLKWKIYILKRLYYLWGLNLLFKIIACEPNKIEKLKAIMRGYHDGFTVKISRMYLK